MWAHVGTLVSMRKALHDRTRVLADRLQLGRGVNWQRRAGAAASALHAVLWPSHVHVRALLVQHIEMLLADEGRVQPQGRPSPPYCGPTVHP